MNPYRLPIADIEEIQNQMYAGIHTVQIPEHAVFDGFSMGGRDKSYLNLSKFARRNGLQSYYIKTFSEYQHWFRAMENRYYEGRNVSILRADVMLDTVSIPWMGRRKYDIAMMYAIYGARYGFDSDECLLHRYNNRAQSIKVSIDDDLEVASYDRTKIRGNTSGVQDRLEFQILQARTLDGNRERHRVTDVSQLRDVLLGLCDSLCGLSLKTAEQAATHDILIEMQKEEIDGGRMLCERSLPDVVSEFEYRIFDTWQVIELGRAMGKDEAYSRRISAQRLGDAKLKAPDFKQFTEIVRQRIAAFAEG